MKNIKPWLPVIIMAILIALFSTFLPAQGGFPKSNPSTLTNPYVVVHHANGTTGVRLDSLGGGGSGIYKGDGTTPTDVDVTITDSLNFDNVLQIYGNTDRVRIGTSSTLPSAQLSIVKDGISTNIVNSDGVVITNNTAATAGIPQQASPGLRFRGQGWASTPVSSMPVDWIIRNVPTSGAANPTSQIEFLASTNNGAYVSRLSLYSNQGAVFASTISAGNTIETAATASFSWGGRSRMTSGANGIITMSNAASTDFTRLIFGTTSNSFPALKVSGPNLQMRTGDDTAFSFMEDNYRRSGSGTPEGVVSAPVGAIYHRTDGTRGTCIYVKESGTGNTGWIIIEQEQLVAEVTTTGTAQKFKTILVDVSAGAATITPPASPVAGDWFCVSDSRANAETFNITVDVSGDKLHAAANDYVMNTDLEFRKFTYVNSTVGWIKSN